VSVPPPPSRTKWTRRAPHPVLIGHAASLPRTSTALPALLARAGPRRGCGRLVERFAKTLRQKSATFERNVCARHTFW